MYDRSANAYRIGDLAGAAKTVDDMICRSHDTQLAYSASVVKGAFALSSIESEAARVNVEQVLTSDEILRRLAEAKVKRIDIANELGIDAAGVTRLYNGNRQLSFDEGQRLVERFAIGDPTVALPVSVARLLILYVANELGAQVAEDDPRAEELAQDVRSLSMFLSDPQVRESTEAVAAFLQGLRLSANRKA